MQFKSAFASKTVWAGILTSAASFLKLCLNVDITDLLPGLIDNVFAVFTLITGLVTIWARIRTTHLIAPKATTGALSVIALLLIPATLSLTSCDTLSSLKNNPQAAAIGSIASAIGAQVIDSAVATGLAKLSGSIKAGNPYLDSAAAGLRTLQGTQLVSAADIQTAIATFGDPAQPDKWKALGQQVAKIVQSYGGKVTSDFALEASATALQQLNSVLLPKAA